MDYEAILRKILRRYGNLTENVRALQVVESKLKLSTATYTDAQNYAVAVGQALKEVFREYLPEALTDGKLYRAAAEVLVEQPMKAAGRDVGNVAKAIQQAMNDEAGIGMNAIVPDMNQDQIDGIITGICNAESYASSENLFLDQLVAFLGIIVCFLEDSIGLFIIPAVLVDALDFKIDPQRQVLVVLNHIVCVSRQFLCVWFIVSRRGSIGRIRARRRGSKRRSAGRRCRG